jgi:CelD/BcsL family acetyltransferase involved in cellulose biosynthesis
MHLRGVPERSALWQRLASRSDVQWIRQTPAFVLSLPPSWEELKKGLPRNTKEALRRCYNALSRDGIACSLEVARRPEEVAPALERFFELHRARAERTDTVQHYDVFESSVAKEFLGDVCREFADRGSLRIFQLRIGGQIVAVRLAFVVGRTLYLYFSGYDQAWAAYHVMTRTLAEAIQHAIGEGLTAVHLSTGRDQSKMRWRPEEIVYLDAVRLSPSRRGRVAHRIFQALDRHLRRGTLAGWTRPLFGRRARPPETWLEITPQLDATRPDEAQEALAGQSPGEA